MVNEELIKDEKTVKLLKEQDFLEGDIYGNGTKVMYANPFGGYAKEKYTLNPLAGSGNVDLIVTGKFVDAMYLLKPTQGRYLFGNRDSKRNVLVEMYGNNIFGLNQTVFDKYQKEIIRPRLVNRIKKQYKIA